MSKEFSITKLMALCDEKKYATTVAGFGVIDVSESIEVPKSFQTSKLAVKAMNILNDNIVNWDYIGEEERQALKDELAVRGPGDN